MLSPNCNFSREFKCRKTRKEKTKYVELFTEINIPLHIVQRRKRKKNGKGIYFQFSRKGQFKENFTALDCNCSVFRHKLMLFSMNSKIYLTIMTSIHFKSSFHNHIVCKTNITGQL
jgi:hypothetical protein